MDPVSPLNQGPTPLPPRPANFGSSSLSPPRRHNPLSPVIIAVLGFLTVLFLGLFIYTLTRWSSAKSDLTLHGQTEYARGKQDQASALDQQVKEQLETPYKGYVAPSVYGEFSVKYPKDWNASANEEPSGSQLNLILDPTTIKLYGNTNPYAAQIILASTAYKSVDDNYKSQVKSGKLKARTITVSGIAGNRYNGTFSDKRTGTVVVIPVRDKTMTIANYNAGYSKEYEQILVQMKIVP